MKLFAVRVAIHLAQPRPDPIQGMKRTAGNLGHAGQWLGVEVAHVSPETRDQPPDRLEDLHSWFGRGVLATASGQVTADFTHRRFDGHVAIHRMTIGGG